MVSTTAIWEGQCKRSFIDWNGQTKVYADPVTAAEKVEKTWSRTPDYRSILAAGGTLPDNPFSYSSSKLQPSWGVAWDYYGRPVTVGPYAGAYTYASPGDLNLFKQQLNSKLIKRAKSQQWNMPVFFAEGKKTMEMVALRAKQIASMAYELRRGHISAFVEAFHNSVIPPKRRTLERWKRQYGRNATDAVGNIWLEARYGWVPFMKDVQDAVNTLMDLSGKPEALATKVTAKASQFSTNTQKDVLVYASDDPYGIRVYCTVIRTSLEDYRATWRFKARSADLPARFGLVNPLEVVWELVPFSFVADWFLPIGDYLAALDVPLRFEHLGGTYGTRFQTMNQVTATSGGTGFAGNHRKLSVSRTVMVDAPSLTLNQMSLTGIASSVSKMVSSISLLNQQVSRLRR